MKRRLCQRNCRQAPDRLRNRSEDEAGRVGEVLKTWHPPLVHRRLPREPGERLAMLVGEALGECDALDPSGEPWVVRQPGTE